jgi:cell division protein FtsI (penicillin-binding protein 3)
MTPIRTLTLYNAIANNGIMVRPQLVTEIQQDGNVKKTFETQILKQSICSEKTLREVQKTLENVVEAGTAKSIRSKYYKIAGKTGTAGISFNKGGYIEAGMKRQQSSFCGYFPADKPKYSCIVVLRTENIPIGEDILGSKHAAPVFKEIADKIYFSQAEWRVEVNKSDNKKPNIPNFKSGMGTDMINVAKTLEIPYKTMVTSGWAYAQTDSVENKALINEQIITKNIVPELKGMGLKDVLYLLGNMGMQVSFKGKGKVTLQSIAAGEKFKFGQKIELTLE